jgi:hypothetical protein
MRTFASQRPLRGVAALLVVAISLTASEAFGDLLFSADFNADVVNALPDVTLPGPPAGDFLFVNESSGTLRVRNAVGTLVNKPVEMNQVPGIGAMDLIGWVLDAGDCTLLSVSWRSLARSNDVCFLACVPRSADGGIIAALMYRGNGVLEYQAAGILPVSYTPDVDQLFEIKIDLLAKTTSLSVDGAALAGFQNVPFVNSSPTVDNLARMGFEAGCIATQDFAVDDIIVETECGTTPVESRTWGSIKAMYR